MILIFQKPTITLIIHYVGFLYKICSKININFIENELPKDTAIYFRASSQENTR